MRKGPKFGSQNYHNSNSQHNSNSSKRYGNIYIQTYNRNPNFINQNHNNQINSNQGQNQRTGHNNFKFPAKQNNNSKTQYNQNFPQNNSNALSNNVQFIDDDSQEMITSISISFKLLRSQQPDEESNFKSRFRMNVFYFPTGDSKKDSGLEIEVMVGTGAA